MPDWTLEYFERGYAQRWGLPPVTDRIRTEISGLWGYLQLNSNARVVDLGCGHGRHALALAEHGSRVVGVDAAVALLTRAQEISSGLGLDVHWIRGDLRRLPLRPEAFDAVLSIDAFGFFETEDENEAVLLEAARVVVPGGRFGLKVVNGSPILADFRAHDRKERDGTIVAVSRVLTREPAHLIEHIEISGSRGSGSYERRQRLYSVDELRAVLERAGLAVVHVFASATGSTFEPAQSPAMWIIGERGV